MVNQYKLYYHMTTRQRTYSQILMQSRSKQQSRLFPFDRDNFTTVKSLQQLKYKVQKQRHKHFLGSFMRFGTSRDPDKNQIYRLYARCKNCEARLSYKKRGDRFLLIKFKNQHNHQIAKNNLEISKQKYFQVFNQIKINDERRGRVIKNYKEVLPSSTNIDKKQRQKIYSLRKQFLQRRMHKNMKFLYRQLLEKKFPVLMLPKQFDKTEVAKIFLLISPKMRKECLQYGHLVNIIVLKDVIAEQKQENDISFLPYNLVLFTGRNNGNKLRIFGIGICLNEATNLHIYFKHMIDFFLTTMKHKPATLATSPLNQISEALKKLAKSQKWKGNHIIYAPHYLKQLQQKFQKREILNQIKSTIYTDSKCLFKSRSAALNSYATRPSEVKYIRQFLNQSQTICRSKIYPSNPSFLGISDRHKIQEALEAHLRQKTFKFQRNMYDAVNLLLILNKTIEKKTSQWQTCQFNHQQIFRDPRLKEVRLTLHADVFEYFLKKLVAALQINVIFLNNHSCKYENSLQTYLINENQEGIWLCDCNQILKIGLPCIHQLKVLDLIGGGNYLDYINKRWFSKDSERYLKEKDAIQLEQVSDFDQVQQIDPENMKKTLKKSRRVKQFKEQQY